MTHDNHNIAQITDKLRDLLSEIGETLRELHRKTEPDKWLSLAPGQEKLDQCGHLLRILEDRANNPFWQVRAFIAWWARRFAYWVER
jgi:hypothetical protein